MEMAVAGGSGSQGNYQDSFLASEVVHLSLLLIFGTCMYIVGMYLLIKYFLYIIFNFSIKLYYNICIIKPLFLF